jgi:lysophospholipase
MSDEWTFKLTISRFFGCNSTSSTAVGSHIPPLIVYLPNHPYSFMSNVSTYDLSYTDGDRNSIITNGYNAVTRGNSTDGYDACIGCAILQRSLVRTGTAIPAACNTCFNNYCWNGQVNDTTPLVYDPTYAVPSAGNATATSSASGSVASSKARMGVVAAVAGIALWMTVG